MDCEGLQEASLSGGDVRRGTMLQLAGAGREGGLLEEEA